MAGRKAILVHDGNGTPAVESRSRTHDPTAISPTCPDLLRNPIAERRFIDVGILPHLDGEDRSRECKRCRTISRHWINDYLYVLDVTNV